MNDNRINISLSKSESLVLFEWIASLGEQEDIPSSIGPAEQRILWFIEGQIESVLVEVFADNYKEILEAAKAEVLG